MTCANWVDVGRNPSERALDQQGAAETNDYTDPRAQSTETSGDA